MSFVMGCGKRPLVKGGVSLGCRQAGMRGATACRIEQRGGVAAMHGADRIRSAGYIDFFVHVCHENRPSRLILFKEGYSMKFGKARCELRNPGPGSHIERLPATRESKMRKRLANSINRRGPMISRKDLARIWQTLKLPT